MYAYNKSANEHLASKLWWEETLNSNQFVGIPWIVYLGFLRIMSGRNIILNPYSQKELITITNSWFEISSVRLLEASEETRSLLEELILKHSLSGSIISDAVIAALSIEHKATLCSNDTDFLRFEQIKLVNPLSKKSG